MPFPKTDEIAGEKEEHQPQLVMHSRDEERIPSLTEVATRTREYLKQGFTDRAIVVLAELEFEAQLNPVQWGIVCRTEWFKPWPLQVRFANGQMSWMKKEVLKLIWPGMPLKDARDYFAHLTSAIQTKQ